MPDLSFSPSTPLPRKRVAAGALFLDAEQRILLVNPTYKPQWEIPGGIVEANEAPLQGCRREVLEELGLTIAPTLLLSVGYLSTRGERGDALRFLFWGGQLDQSTIEKIRLPAVELSEYRFCTLAEAGALVRPALHAQITQALALLQLGPHPAGALAPNYWEEGTE